MADVLLAVVAVALIHACLALLVALQVGLAVHCVATLVTASSFVGAVAVNHRAHARLSAFVFAMEIFCHVPELFATKSAQDRLICFLQQLNAVEGNSVGGPRPLVHSAGTVVDSAAVKIGRAHV